MRQHRVMEACLRVLGAGGRVGLVALEESLTVLGLGLTGVTLLASEKALFWV